MLYLHKKKLLKYLLNSMKTLKITKEAHEGLDWLKESINAPSYSICIFESVRFFRENNVSPRSSIFNNFEDSFSKFKNELITNFGEIKEKEHVNSERIIKLIRRIEIDSVLTIREKTNEIHSIITQDIDKKIIENNLNSNIDLDNHSIESANLTIKNEKLIGVNSELSKSVFEKDNLISDLENSLKEYKRCLETLNKNVRYSTGIGAKKIFIDLTVEEVENLFYLIP